MDAKPGVALVLPGGGARGAYEIGALSVLLPRLEAAGERVSVVCGTSVGAINAALIGSLAHVSASEQVESALELWRGLRRRDILEPIVGPHLVRLGLGAVGELLGIQPWRLRGLLDARPLRRRLGEWIDWDRIGANVRRGDIDAICVLATALSDDLPTAFVSSGPDTIPDWTSEEIRYTRVRLGPEHVRASAAIPALFPPVRVDAPRAAAGYYIDGATRLNTPIKPALDLGADRLVVVGFEPLTARRRPTARPRAPQLADIAANVMDGLLLDQVNEDLRRMAAINVFFTGEASGAFDPRHTRAAQAYREARGRRPYRRIRYAIVAPRSRRTLGRIAERVFVERHSGLRALASPDDILMRRLLGPPSDARGELLSFLLFDEHYLSALIDAGRQDAQRWLARHPRIWCSDPGHDFGRTLQPSVAAQEIASIEEWRALRRN